jgi:hypothetical protein
MSSECVLADTGVLRQVASGVLWGSAAYGRPGADGCATAHSASSKPGLQVFAWRAHPDRTLHDQFISFAFALPDSIFTELHVHDQSLQR